VAEWRLFGSLLEGAARVEYDDLLAEAHHAIGLADAAAAKVLEGVQA
jgi:hypothetical protein